MEKDLTQEEIHENLRKECDIALKRFDERFSIKKQTT